MGEGHTVSDTETPLTPAAQAEHVAAIRATATQLAEQLRGATDAGVSHAVILPQLVLVFREVFGEMPAGLSIPGMPQIPGVTS